MNRNKTLLRWGTLALLVGILLVPASATLGQRAFQLSDCRDVGFSTSEEFITHAGTPPDGNPIISDGDLLGRYGKICARNAHLLQIFQVTQDLGLDAADVIDIELELVVLSTELDSPYGNFKAGDLLTNKGAVVPNVALLAKFGNQPDMGLDAIHFVGQTDRVRTFLGNLKERGREFFVQNPNVFPALLVEHGVDLLFSIEGTIPLAGAPMILDGDLLSAATGSVVRRNGQWLDPPIPAGLPQRGVDFGLDAFGADCFAEDESSMRFSTELLYRSQDGAGVFTDGDVLKHGGAVEWTNWDLTAGFEPLSRMMGLDALTYPYWRERCEQPKLEDYLPIIYKKFRMAIFE